MAGTSTENPATILIVDDESRFRRAMRSVLLAQGYDVLEARDGEQALTAFWSRGPDLVLLDVNMPIVDGFEVCRQIRCGSSASIIMLTVRSSAADKVQALDAGADDYVVKPFGVDELLARIRSVLRRASKGTTTTFVRSERLAIDFERRIIAVSGRPIHLTPKEFDVLRELVMNDGKPVTHRRLLSSVWGPGHEDDVDSLRVIVNRLREKIELDPTCPKYVQTEPFVGYRFALHPGASGT